MIPGVRKGLYRNAYDAVVAHLKAHPLLANGRAIKTWATWQDSARGAPKTDPPAVELMPFCQVRLLGGPQERMTGARTSGGPCETVSSVRLAIALDLWIKGQDVGDLADVGELVYDALFPADRAERSALEARLDAAAIADHRMTRPILPLSAESYQNESVHGQGVLEITLQISS